MVCYARLHLNRTLLIIFRILYKFNMMNKIIIAARNTQL